MMKSGLCWLLLAAFQVSAPAQGQQERNLKAEGAALRTLLKGSPGLEYKQTDFPIQLPAGWVLEYTSSMAVDRQGAVYIFQRGDQADPVIVADRDGRILRSWGKGLFKIPHSIRVDPEGNIWTVDAGVSKVHKFTPQGKLLLEIDIGEIPTGKTRGFGGTTDIAFGPDGRLFISDGYGNARILEYSPQGKRLREWGRSGGGPGEFRLPHGIAIDGENVVYVADRENGRIQRFTIEGRYIGEWNNLGKTFSLKVSPGGDLWIGTQPADVGNGVEPWLVKVDRRTGKVLGAMPSEGHHSIDLNAEGEPLTGARPTKILWFRSSRR